MITILPPSSLVHKTIKKHSLQNKFRKHVELLSQNPRHPSLHVELLEPKQHGIYSFRIDRKYRALFFFRPDQQGIEILAVTIHYQ